MPDLRIRRYEPADADAVWTLHERALRDVGAYDEEYAHLDADLRVIEEEYLDGGGEFLVGELASAESRDVGTDTTIVAMGAVQPAPAVNHHDGDSTVGVIRRMRVDPAHQRQGYGSAILTALERRAHGSDFERLVLDTRETQAAARALYESYGYEETGRESIPDGEMIYYEKDCSGRL